jgi:hypothetical protein
MVTLKLKGDFVSAYQRKAFTLGRLIFIHRHLSVKGNASSSELIRIFLKVIDLISG